MIGILKMVLMDLFDAFVDLVCFKWARKGNKK